MDRTNIYLLFENLMNGKTTKGLEIFNTLYNEGADPGIIIQDLLEIVHWLSRLVLTPEISKEPGVSQIDKEKGLELSKKLDMSELSQTWQMLLKGYQELESHEMPHIVAEMILIRLAFASKLPSLNEISANLNAESKQEEAVTNDESKTSTIVEEKKNDLTKDKKQSGISSDTVMEMKNIETLAKKQNFEENNIPNIKAEKEINVKVIIEQNTVKLHQVYHLLDHQIHLCQ